MVEYDLHIKDGVVIDGTRLPRYRADVWIKDGRIAQIGGPAPGTAREVIDAAGKIVAPGFIDVHTHYDAQIRWDPWCTISGWHGVTSVVLGNCGFGFAPCKEDFRERSMLTMTRVEAIPYASMKAGLPWDWETIPEYMDSLDAAPKGVNCLQYMPTASLMTYVMGLEAAKSRPATPEERQEMKRLLHEGMDAGLCGFSIQRMGENSVQSDYDGTPMVTDTMCDADLLNLCEVLAERDEGFVEITHDVGDDAADRAFVEKMATVSKRPIIWNPVFATNDPAVHKSQMAWLDETNERGLRIFGQAASVRSGFVFTAAEWNLYDSAASWNHATQGTREERRAKFADPALRQGLRDEVSPHGLLKKDGIKTTGGPLTMLIVNGVNNQPELMDYLGKSLGQIAEEEGKHVVDVFLDLSLAGDLEVEFMQPRPEARDPTFTAELLSRSRYTFPGVSDGGAHTKFYNGGCFTTDFLLWLARDEKAITLEEAHFRLSALPAHAAGFRDRGVLREGAPADVLVYDLAELAIEPHWIGEIVHDLPAGEWRRVSKARGYKAIIVNGEVTFRDGECTGATPGKLLRGGRG